MSLSCFLPYPTKEIKPDQGEMGKCKEYVEKFEQEVRNLVSRKRTRRIAKAQQKTPIIKEDSIKL